MQQSPAVKLLAAGQERAEQLEGGLAVETGGPEVGGERAPRRPAEGEPEVAFSWPCARSGEIRGDPIPSRTAASCSIRAMAPGLAPSVRDQPQEDVPPGGGVLRQVGGAGGMADGLRTRKRPARSEPSGAECPDRTPVGTTFIEMF